MYINDGDLNVDEKLLHFREFPCFSLFVIQIFYEQLLRELLTYMCAFNNS